MLINSELPVKCPTQVKGIIIMCLAMMQWEPFAGSSRQLPIHAWVSEALINSAKHAVKWQSYLLK